MLWHCRDKQFRVNANLIMPDEDEDVENRRGRKALRLLSLGFSWPRIAGTTWQAQQRVLRFPPRDLSCSPTCNSSSIQNMHCQLPLLHYFYTVHVAILVPTLLEPIGRSCHESCSYVICSWPSSLVRAGAEEYAT